jgi:ribonuclease BN (tRNA processing enzyme)
MRLTVLGGCGAWPAAGQACSGYLIEHDGFRLLVDPGYATLPRLLAILPAESVDAVLVSHGHPDHCADLNPLLRARVLQKDAQPPLPVYSLPGAIDQVLALDEPEMMRPGLVPREFGMGDTFSSGPFGIEAFELPHFVPNAGLPVPGRGQLRRRGARQARRPAVLRRPGGQGRGRGRGQAADPHPPVARHRPEGRGGGRRPALRRRHHRRARKTYHRPP